MVVVAGGVEVVVVGAGVVVVVVATIYAQDIVVLY